MYETELNASNAVTHEPVTSGAGSAEERFEPYLQERTRTVRAQVDDIIHGVINSSGSAVTYSDVMGHSRYAEVVAVRHQAIAEVYLTFPWMSYPQLGRLFNRDHSSIMHCLTKLGVRKSRYGGGGGGGWSLSARLYGVAIDVLFVRIGAALSVSAIPTEGANPHETA